MRSGVVGPYVPTSCTRSTRGGGGGSSREGVVDGPVLSKDLAHILHKQVWRTGVLGRDGEKRQHEPRTTGRCLTLIDGVDSKWAEWVVYRSRRSVKISDNMGFVHPVTDVNWLPLKRTPLPVPSSDGTTPWDGTSAQVDLLTWVTRDTTRRQTLRVPQGRQGPLPVLPLVPRVGVHSSHPRWGLWTLVEDYSSRRRRLGPWHFKINVTIRMSRFHNIRQKIFSDQNVFYHREQAVIVTIIPRPVRLLSPSSLVNDQTE